jgi:hypothetical protein
VGSSRPEALLLLPPQPKPSASDARTTYEIKRSDISAIMP